MEGPMHWLRCPARRRLTVLVQLTSFLAACMTWRTEPIAPANLIANQKPSVVRITRTDSSRVTLREPAIRGDSLYGTSITEAVARPMD
jgi:hypothetical protein